MGVAQLSQILPSHSPDMINKHAEAVASLGQLHDELVSVHDINDQLRADLHREQDRVDLLIAERDRWRVEALTFRGKLIELTTIMTKATLLMRPAEEVLLSIDELTKADSEAISKLAQAFDRGNADKKDGDTSN